jgi:4-hydroxyphenylacetate 3-monooxygenase
MLAWDAVGSEFGSRHTQYEMFYAGATFVTKGHSFRCFDWDACAEMVDSMLPALPPEVAAEPAPALRASG